jgi:hypothetical protein
VFLLLKLFKKLFLETYIFTFNKTDFCFQENISQKEYLQQLKEARKAAEDKSSQVIVQTRYDGRSILGLGTK